MINKNFLQWLMRSRRIALIFITIIYLMILTVPYIGRNAAIDVSVSYGTAIMTASCLSCAIAIILVFLTFSYIHHKRSVDMYFSLPVSRKEQLITGCLLAWLLPAGLFLIGTLIVWLMKFTQNISVTTWLLIQIWTLPALAVAVMSAALVNALANNLFDAFVLLCAYLALPFAVMIVLSVFSSFMVPGNILLDGSESAWLLSPPLMTVFNAAALANKAGTFSWRYMVSMCIFAVICIVGLKKEMIERKSERAEQISNDFFAYPFIINIYSVLVLMIYGMWIVSGNTDFRQMIIYYIALFAVYMIASFIYRRSFQINWKVISLFLLEAVLCMIISVCGWNARGFGRADHYSLNNNQGTAYSLSEWVSKDDLGIEAGEIGHDEMVYVTLSVTVPAGEQNEYKDVIDLMENYRKKQINLFYKKRAPSSISGTFTISPLTGSYSIHLNDTYQYDIYQLFSEEELIRISRMDSVQITVSDGDVSSSVPLNIFLANRDGDRP